ncbi:alpha/beta hydrolase [Planctomonas deserti]|uniref:alpha/beta hydrolase n=1 Tax=Planctomonas deserti TaxID=2144185 RepID=UPI000D37A36A|nr:alpha/beta fold hydrolase [Planctomonas deserti]
MPENDEDPPLLDPAAVLWSAPLRDLHTRPLLVLLHGFGSHEGDLFGLSPLLPLQPIVASVRAPLRHGSGHAWFPVPDERHGDTAPALADAAADAVLTWLDVLPVPRSVGLLGFSQGGAVALQLLRRAPRRFAYAVALSGFVVSPGDDVQADAELERVRPPVFWGRGTADRVIPDDAVDRTQEWLPRHSTLTERIYEDVAHGVSQPELRDIGAFIRANTPPS